MKNESSVNLINKLTDCPTVILSGDTDTHSILSSSLESYFSFIKDEATLYSRKRRWTSFYRDTLYTKVNACQSIDIIRYLPANSYNEIIACRNGVELFVPKIEKNDFSLNDNSIILYIWIKYSIASHNDYIYNRAYIIDTRKQLDIVPSIDNMLI
jgi:hypothetical protein